MPSPGQSFERIRDAKRELRAESAALRRRLSRRKRRLMESAVRAVSWRTYVARRPGLSFASAFGVGWLLGRRREVPRKLSKLLTSLAPLGVEAAARLLKREFAEGWGAAENRRSQR